jgi:hypothetical protein
MQESKRPRKDRIDPSWCVSGAVFGLALTYEAVSYRFVIIPLGIWLLDLGVLVFFVIPLVVLWAIAVTQSAGRREFLSTVIAPIFVFVAQPNLWFPGDFAAQIRLRSERAELDKKIEALPDLPGHRILSIPWGEGVTQSYTLVYDEAGPPDVGRDEHETTKKISGHFYLMTNSFFP